MTSWIAAIIGIGVPTAIIQGLGLGPTVLNALSRLLAGH